MSEQTRKLIFLIGFVAVCGIRLYFAQQVKQNQIQATRQTAQEKFLLFLAGLGMFILPLVGVFTPSKFADYTLPGWTGWLGTIMIVLAIVLFWRSHTDLGLNWSGTLKIRENHSLVETGVYHYIRHPMYASCWLWGIAQALLLQNWIYGLSYLTTFVPLYFVRVPQEEQMMLDTFGDEYRAYMQQAGQVIPKLRGLA